MLGFYPLGASPIGAFNSNPQQGGLTVLYADQTNGCSTGAVTIIRNDVQFIPGTLDTLVGRLRDGRTTASSHRGRGVPKSSIAFDSGKVSLVQPFVQSTDPANTVYNLELQAFPGQVQPYLSEDGTVTSIGFPAGTYSRPFMLSRNGVFVSVNSVLEIVNSTPSLAYQTSVNRTTVSGRIRAGRSTASSHRGRGVPRYAISFDSGRPSLIQPFVPANDPSDTMYGVEVQPFATQVQPRVLEDGTFSATGFPAGTYTTQFTLQRNGVNVPVNAVMQVTDTNVASLLYSATLGSTATQVNQSSVGAVTIGVAVNLVGAGCTQQANSQTAVAGVVAKIVNLAGASSLQTATSSTSAAMVSRNVYLFGANCTQLAVSNIGSTQVLYTYSLTGDSVVQVASSSTGQIFVSHLINLVGGATNQRPLSSIGVALIVPPAVGVVNITAADSKQVSLSSTGVAQIIPIPVVSFYGQPTVQTANSSVGAVSVIPLLAVRDLVGSFPVQSATSSSGLVTVVRNVTLLGSSTSQNNSSAVASAIVRYLVDMLGSTTVQTPSSTSGSITITPYVPLNINLGSSNTTQYAFSTTANVIVFSGANIDPSDIIDTSIITINGGMPDASTVKIEFSDLNVITFMGQGPEGAQGKTGASSIVLNSRTGPVNAGSLGHEHTTPVSVLTKDYQYALDAFSRQIPVDGAGPTNQILLKDSSVLMIEGRVVTMQGQGLAAASWNFLVTLRRASGPQSVAIVGQPKINGVNVNAGALVQPTVADPVLAQSAIAISADTINGGLKLSAQGQDGVYQQWTAMVDTVEVGYI